MKPTPTARLGSAYFDTDSELPAFYLAIEQACFDSVTALCKRMGWPRALITKIISSAPAPLDGGDRYTAIDLPVLGAPDDHVRAVIFSLASGGVVVCEDKFDDLTDSVEVARADAQRVAEKHPDKRVFICELWPPASASAGLH